MIQVIDKLIEDLKYHDRRNHIQETEEGMWILNGKVIIDQDKKTAIVKETGAVIQLHGKSKTKLREALKLYLNGRSHKQIESHESQQSLFCVDPREAMQKAREKYEQK